jgi:hypothetical protein
VELAIERQQELPALIYESRPVSRPYQRGMWRRPAGAPGSGGDSVQGGAAGPPPEASRNLGTGAAAGGSAVAAALAQAGRLLGARGDGSPSHRTALLAGQGRSSDDMTQEMSRSPRHQRSPSRTAGAVPLAEGTERGDGTTAGVAVAGGVKPGSSRLNNLLDQPGPVAAGAAEGAEGHAARQQLGGPSGGDMSVGVNSSRSGGGNSRWVLAMFHVRTL